MLNHHPVPYPQGLAAGLMLSLAIFDLVPASLQEIGPAKAYLAFFAGVALFGAVIAIIPEPPQSFLAPEDASRWVKGG